MNDDRDDDPETLTLRQADRVDRVCDRFEAAWRAGERPVIEEYLGEATGPEQSALLRELIAADVEWRRRRGEHPVMDEYRDRFPGSAEVVRAAFPGDDRGMTVDNGPDRDGARSPRRESASASQGARFRILRPHAKGGLGEVYVALDGELNREVALKEILPPHALNPESRARFLVEAEITGGLEHPGIVPVYSLGYHTDGRPYYAMRLIRGDSLKEAITRFHAADGPGRDAGQRALELRRLVGRFLDVCNAVAYAHSRGVLHRDLKPANVMLGPYGETLVVDWGLAKTVGPHEGTEDLAGGALQPSSASDRSLTQPGSVLGTPAYMSPEQAAGHLEELGAASDVYSLGATLYTLLAGRAPFEGDVLEVRQRVRRGEFAPPRAIRPGVPRGLEAICLKAMALRPEDRYASPRLLAVDVERWLADEPVSAWREPPAARARRWMRRHRTVMAAGVAAVGVALVGLATVLAVQTQAKGDLEASYAKLGEANRRLLVANASEVAARRAAQDRFHLALEAIQSYHQGASTEVLEKRPELEDLRKQLLQTALDFYRRLKVALDGGPASDPTTRADLAEATARMASITGKVGSRTEALSLYEQALDLWRALVRDHPGVADYRLKLGLTLTIDSGLQDRTGRPSQGQANVEEALAILDPLVRDHPGVASYRAALVGALRWKGQIKDMEGRTAEALEAHQRARDLCRELVRDHPGAAKYPSDLAKTLHALSNVQSRTGRAPEAMKTLDEAVEVQRSLVGSHPDIADYQHGLARTLGDLAKLQFATGHRVQALASFEETRKHLLALVRDHPVNTYLQTSLAQAHGSLGLVLTYMDRVAEALEPLEKARDLLLILSRGNPAVVEHRLDLSSVYSNLGNAEVSLERPTRALEAYIQSRDVLRALVGEQPRSPRYQSNLARVLNNIGNVQIDLGRSAQAVSAFEEARGLLERVLRDAPDNFDHQIMLGWTLGNLGNALTVLGREDDARAAYERGIDQLRQTLARSPQVTTSRPSFAKQLAALAVLERRRGRAAEADALALRYRQHCPGDSATPFGWAGEIASKTKPAGQGQDEVTDEQRAVHRLYADQAVELVRQAIANGYQDVGQLASNPRLAPLRVRADFRAVILDAAFPSDPFAK